MFVEKYVIIIVLVFHFRKKRPKLHWKVLLFKFFQVIWVSRNTSPFVFGCFYNMIFSYKKLFTKSWT